MNRDREETMDDIYENLNHVREDRDCRTNTHQQLHNTGRVCVKRYRAATVCLVLLCFLLLMVIILMCVQTKCSTEEKNQLLINISNITDQRNQLLTNISNNMKQKYQLPTNISNLISLNRQLNQEKNKILTILTDGWIYYKYSFYFISTESKNWTDSRSYCRERNADLIIINSEEEQEWAEKIAVQNPFWIGLNDIDVEGRWKWVDGTELKSDSSFWYESEPNGGRTEDCVLTIIWNAPYWADYPCRSNYKWICEKMLIY